MRPNLFRSSSLRRSLALLTALGSLSLLCVPRAFAQESPLEDTPGEDPLSSDDTSSSSDEASVEVSTGGGLFESASSSSDSESSSAGLSFELGGYVRGDTFIGVVPTGDGRTSAGINAAYGELSLQPTIRKGTWGSAFADMRFRYGQQLSDSGLFLDLREAYVNLYAGPFDIRLGKQIVVWGRADAFNPTNNLSAVDFRIRSPMEDDRRLGNIGARVYLNLLPFRVEGVWMPLYVATTYPDVEINRFVRFQEPRYPTQSLGSGTFAGRLHLELDKFDASVSYLYGYAPLPGFEYNSYLGGMGAETPERPAVFVTRTAYNHHVIGGDFSTTIGDWLGVRGEAAFRSPIRREERPFTPKPDLQWVLGVDHEFGDVMIIAQYLGRYTFNWEPKRFATGSDQDLINANDGQPNVNLALSDLTFNSNQMLFNQLKEVQHLASVRAEWKLLQEKLSISALGLVNFSTSEWALMPKVGYQITGGLSAYVGGEIYAGPEGTLFYMVREALSSGYFELRASF